MTNDEKILEEYPSGLLFRSAVRNLVKKQAFRLLVSAISAKVSFWVIYRFTAWLCNRSIHGLLINLLFLIMFMAGVGGFVSNLGSFSVKRYVLGATVSGTALYIFLPFYNCLGAMDFRYGWSGFWRGGGIGFLDFLPVLVVSLFIVILPLIIFVRIHKKA